MTNGKKLAQAIQRAKQARRLGRELRERAGPIITGQWNKWAEFRDRGYNKLLLVLPIALITMAAGFLFPSAAAAPAVPPRVQESQPVTMEVLTTGYTAHDPGENGKGITYTGTRARPGEAAVDPRVIPLGTVLWVPGYGIAHAEDVGGAVQGKHVDLFFLDRKTALAWGRRTESVTILSRGGGNVQ